MRSYLHIVTFIILSFAADCEARVHVVYKSIGEKAHLTLKEHRNITSVKWRKDHELIATVGNQKSVMKHPEKFHLDTSDNSLYIHNLTMNDCGIYRAQTGQWEEEVIQYKLIVQEAIPKPEINPILVQQSNSSSVCHIRVKCTADGESVTYDCDNQQCIQTNVTSTRVNFVINYTDNRELECTASNHVSTKRTSIPTNNICSDMQTVPIKTTNYILIIIITLCPVVFAVLCAGIHQYCTRKKKQNEGTYQEDKGISTVYSVVCKQPRTEAPEDSSAAQNATTTVYDVPSNCARAPHSVDSIQNDDTNTVYWKLGQTQDQ